LFVKWFDGIELLLLLEISFLVGFVVDLFSFGCDGLLVELEDLAGWKICWRLL
jgi:hypothetical protein